jgi:UDP-N-acetylglucosamine--N-acetylmuramyl-(pentapeptide) pyrophosphoryl-undecaprenol N-acetylglucosamine transferase
VLGKLVRRVFVAFDAAASRFARRKVRFVGNPVRRSFLDRVAAANPADEGQAIVILGGSQGSRAVNDLVAQMVRVLDARGRLPPIIHQTGADLLDEMKVNYAAHGLEGRVEVRAFIDDMPAVLSKAALCIARAGALTLAELAIMRRPAILIPLPTAADDHQTMNALAFERAGAAVLVPQAKASATGLADLVDEILQNPARRAAMSAAMGTLARASATHDIAAELSAIARR